MSISCKLRGEVQLTNLDEKIGKIERILVQLYAARVSNDFCDATSDCRRHIEPFL